MRLLGMLIGAWAAVIVSTPQPVPPTADAQTWITITLVAVVAIIALVLAGHDRINVWLGGKAAPLISAHNSSPIAHPDVVKAVALLSAAVEDLQHQISAADEHRREQFDSLQRSVQLAIELLRDVR